MPKKTGLIVIILLLAVFLSALDKSIQDIKVYGNKKVSTERIKKVILLKKGRKFSAQNLIKSEKRLESLNTFSRVSIETKDIEKNKIIIIISVKEKKGLVYLGLKLICNNLDEFNFSEEDEHLYLGFTLGLHDFSGHLHNISVFGGYGGQDKIGIKYSKDFFNGFHFCLITEYLWYESNIFNTDLSKGTVKTHIKKVFANFTAKIWGEYSRLETVDQSLQFFQPVKLYKFGFLISYNSQDLQIFPTRGLDVSLGAFRAYDTEFNKVYDRYFFSFSAFLKAIGSHIMAVNFRSVFSEGINIPFSEKIYFGGYQTLRGMRIREYVGGVALIMSFEYRIPLSFFSKSSMIGSAVYIFSDFGVIAEEKDQLEFSNIKNNSGFGFILTNRQNVLRIDFSVYPEIRLRLGTGWKF